MRSESASRSLVCFGGLIDTTIKGLTILLSIWAEIDYHICYICDEMYQCSRQNSYNKMNATTWSSMRMITSNEYCVNWDVLLVKNSLPYLNEACWSMWYSKWQVKVLRMRQGCMLMHSLIFWKSCYKNCMWYLMIKQAWKKWCSLKWQNQCKFKRALVNKWMRSRGEFLETM